MVSILHQEDVEAVIEAKHAALTGMTTSTTANLSSLTSAINTAGKKNGKMVFNDTTNVIVVADGSTPASVWNTTAGILAHTPV